MKLKIIILFIFLIFGSIIFYSFYPYKILKGLPNIDLSDVDDVSIWMKKNKQGPFLNIKSLESKEEVEQILTMYAQVKEAKVNMGTTSDMTVIIKLKDNSQINIWYLYSDKYVSIRHMNVENKYFYYTFVRSEDLAFYLEQIRSDFYNKMH